MSTAQIITAVAVPIIVAVITATGVIISRKAQKGSREAAFIDDLQEQINTQGQDIAGLKTEMEALKNRELRLMDYTNELRKHINAELGPPPPPWPEGLYQ